MKKFKIKNKIKIKKNLKKVNQYHQIKKKEQVKKWSDFVVDDDKDIESDALTTPKKIRNKHRVHVEKKQNQNNKNKDNEKRNENINKDKNNNKSNKNKENPIKLSFSGMPNIFVTPKVKEYAKKKLFIERLFDSILYNNVFKPIEDNNENAKMKWEIMFHKGQLSSQGLGKWLNTLEVLLVFFFFFC